MNRHSIVGTCTALLGILGLIFLLSGDSHFPIHQWPYEAYQGLVFSFVWGFGISPTIGHLYSVFVIVTVTVLSFAIGHKLSRIFSR
ncbi:hypothetical protein F0231_12245 [Vibrio sp. RE86]|uniref:hypothetical protein n=1 Tax=Vibrio sp. RE86 TaxID=2607605 RepID=UPI0014939022|nr:hypothetical protein [Vibrio sp. RE86]NOH80511.1 hypothetical protein [Vibrio sp. RE86]